MALISPEHSPSWRPRTVLTHSGLLRSQFDETCEAIFMTSGYVYGTAEEAEAAFKNDGSRYVYSRYANPTDHHVRGAPAHPRRRRGVPRRPHPAWPRCSPPLPAS